MFWFATQLPMDILFLQFASSLRAGIPSSNPQRLVQRHAYTKCFPHFWEKKKSGSCALNQNLCLKPLEASQDKQGMLSVSRNKAAHSKAWGKEKPRNLSPMKAGSCVCFVHFFVLPVADNSCSMNTCCKKYYHAQKGALKTANTIQRFLLITACI